MLYVRTRTACLHYTYIILRSGWLDVMIMTRDKSFYKTLIRLAIPISLQYFITFAINLADNIMVGTLGDNAISGVYMGTQLQTVLQMFVGGIEGAILVLAAQYWGIGDKSSIKRIVAIAIKLAFSCGIIVSAAAILFPMQIVGIFTNNAGIIAEGAVYLRIIGFSYIFFCVSQVLIATMRSVEVARIGLYTSILAFVLNILLNYVLIFGKLGFPAMGIKGAALATLISRIAEAAVMIIYVFRVDKRLNFNFADILPTDKKLLRDFLRYGLPIIGGNLVWSVNMVGQTAILGHFDSEEVIAATSIALMLHNLVYVWMNGLSSAVGIITGKTVGAGEYEKMKQYAKTVQIIFLCVGVLSGAFTFLIKNSFISLYTTSIGSGTGISAGAQAYAQQFINVISITLIGTCYQAACLFGLVKSGGDISFVFKMDTIAVVCVLGLASLAAFVFNAAPWIVFACLKADQIAKCLVAVIKINSFNWMKNLTRSNVGEAEENP